ncbi:hypothetical protein [Deinococcus sp. Marseille-Q6407]|nr:hypothetical protein [Deinococcus sp. Marseille-Q6407]
MDIRFFSFVADDETDCYILALGEDEESALMLELAYHFDDQDKKLG